MEYVVVTLVVVVCYLIAGVITHSLTGFAVPSLSEDERWKLWQTDKEFCIVTWAEDVQSWSFIFWPVALPIVIIVIVAKMLKVLANLPLFSFTRVKGIYEGFKLIKEVRSGRRTG